VVERVGAAGFERLLREGTTFIDVRAEVEFAHGAIPGAVNLPILTSAEREQVGTCYKRRGQAAAIELGHSLVNGETKAARVARWCELARAHPGAHLYCWRGGLRSGLAAQWMADAGVAVPVIEGGYKALRHRLLEELAAPQPREPWIVIGGRTGSAKTALVNTLPGGVDLEGFARHRGSSFGRRIDEPPAQAGFENALAVALLRRRHAAPGATLFFEDESRQIGAVTIPPEVYAALKAAPLAVVEVALAERVDNILQDYICADLAAWLAQDPQGGFARFAEQLLASLARIQRRLGSERHRVAEGLMRAALGEHGQRADPSGHRAWIELLLAEYYDPMYDYQLGKSAGRIAFRGEREAVRAWCLAQEGTVQARGPAPSG
jgi:tRNA 2-selenouridine synthase